MTALNTRCLGGIVEAHSRIIKTCKHIITQYQLPGGGGGPGGLSAAALTGCDFLYPLEFHRLRARCEEPPETKDGSRLYQHQVDLLQTNCRVADPSHTFSGLYAPIWNRQQTKSTTKPTRPWSIPGEWGKHSTYSAAEGRVHLNEVEVNYIGVGEEVGFREC